MRQLERTNYFPKNTPEQYKYCVNFLISTYPLQNTQHLIWEFENRPRCSSGATGLASLFESEGKIYTTCTVAMGFIKKPRTAEEVLHTICHEYCHAMQYDRSEPGDCTAADLFADQVVLEFSGRVAA